MGAAAMCGAAAKGKGKGKGKKGKGKGKGKGGLMMATPRTPRKRHDTIPSLKPLYWSTVANDYNGSTLWSSPVGVGVEEQLLAQSHKLRPSNG